MSERGIQEILTVIPDAIKFVLSDEARSDLQEIKANVGEMYPLIEECINTVIRNAAESVQIAFRLCDKAFPGGIELSKSRGGNPELEMKIADQVDTLITIIPYSSDS